MRRRSVLLALVWVLAATGCGAATEELHGEIPYCDNWDTLRLEAQSVPTAPILPCLDSLPLGWSAQAAKIDSDGTTITLDSDRGGEAAVVVRFAASCDVGDAIAVPTDEIGARRFEYVEQVVRGFSGRRHYLLAGEACVTYEFDFAAEASAALVTEASAALTFVSRQEVASELEASTDGRLTL